MNDDLVESEVSSNRSSVDAELDRIEYEIGRLHSERSRLRGTRPADPVSDYLLTTGAGAVRLSDLFGSQREMMLIHNMGAGCSYCTLWADGFIGLLPHLEERAAFLLVSPDSPGTQEALSKARGWPFRMASAAGTSLFQDLGFADQSGRPMPGISTLRLDGDRKILRTQRAEFGPGDQFCAAWHLFDLLDGGVAGWEPGAH